MSIVNPDLDKVWGYDPDVIPGVPQDRITIGKKLGISPQRVDQIERHALKKIRAYLQAGKYTRTCVVCGKEFLLRGEGSAADTCGSSCTRKHKRK